MKIYNDEIKVEALLRPERLPWLDIALPEEAIKFLWDTINHVDNHTNAKNDLAGNISKSAYIPDKDNWFYENVLKELVSALYYRDWNNYYGIEVLKIAPPPVFSLESMWVNYQKQHEFNPPHNHHGDCSFVVFMKIPTHWKEQHALPFCTDTNSPCASDFEFLTPDGGMKIASNKIALCPEDEGKMLFFPAWLTHQVFPFYGTEEERITISGNIVIES
jgi:hypothetical protein